MMHNFYLFLGILPFLFVTVESSVVPWDTPFELDKDWNKDKLDALLDMVKGVLKNTGCEVTIVASQNIHNADGTLKEIKTVELKIPNRFTKHHENENDKSHYLEKLKDYGEEFDDLLVKAQRDFKKAYLKGYNQEVAYQSLLMGGDADLEIYVNKDKTYLYDEDGMGYYLMDNIRTDDKKKLEEEIKTYFEKKNDVTFSVLLWDGEGKFLSNESKVEPMLLAYVDKACEHAEEQMMNTAIEALSKYALNYPLRVPKELSAAMANAHPNYTWWVTKWQEENAENAKHDIYIKVTYDNVKPGEALMMYTIYGVKK